MKRLADFRKQVIEGWTVQRIAAVLIVVGLVVFVGGVVNKHCTCAGWPNLGETLYDVVSDFYANVSVDCLSIAFAILVIDRLNERRGEKELKAQLIREMGYRNNGIAIRAVQELAVRGWLKDGTLRNVWLRDANLQGANLFEADLQGAIMYGVTLHKAWMINANLQGAKYLSARQLIQPDGLHSATMPDGSRYDGRYDLAGDRRRMLKQGTNINNAEAVAAYYGVSLEEYLAGQAWARENLPRLRRAAGLDPDTGLPVEPTNGIEPPPTDAPAPPAPRRNGHKASMVTHRVRR
jgi:hypothetical protein